MITFDLKILAHFAIDEVYLTEISSSHFGEEAARRVYQDFREELAKVVFIMREQCDAFPYFVLHCGIPVFILCQVENVIEKRNKRLIAEGKIPYTVLLPSKIPAGIAV